MFLRQALCMLTGFCSGLVIAGGVFAFLVIIGVITRFTGRTKTIKRVRLYEDILLIGGICGNTVDLFFKGDALLLHAGIGYTILAAGGLSIGIFVGCLAMSLAETVKAFPIICRRIKVSGGLQYIVLSIAIGKLIGSLLFFTQDMSA